MEENKLYDDIAQRTGGDIYIGVVGPVRTGKSTFIKRFMETLGHPQHRKRLPPGAGPRRAAPERLRPDGDDRRAQVRPRGGRPGGHGRRRLLRRAAHRLRGLHGPRRHGPDRGRRAPDGDHPLVRPRHPHDTGRRAGHPKVIAEHSTIGVVVTTDGTITDIPREDYWRRRRGSSRAQVAGKALPVVLLHSTYPQSDRAKAIRADIVDRMTSPALRCQLPDAGRGTTVTCIIKGVLYEFPVRSWTSILPRGWTRCPTSTQSKTNFLPSSGRKRPSCAAPGSDAGHGGHRRRRGASAPHPGDLHRPGAGWPPRRWRCPAALFYDTHVRSSPASPSPTTET